MTQVYKQYKDFVLIRLFTAVFLQVIGCKLKIPDCSLPVLGGTIRAIREVMGGGSFLVVSIIVLNIIPCTNFFFISTYNFPYLKVSARIFFFKLFWYMNFFPFCFPCAIFIFAFPPPSLPPSLFLMVRPLVKLQGRRK